MQVRRSPPAADDLEHICDRIAEDNPGAVPRVAETIVNGCDGLKRFPYLGRLNSMAGRRDLLFPPLPYIVVCRVTAHAVEISHIFHGAQDWPWPHPGRRAPTIVER
jgi:toxin ParE1/3/4